MWIFTPFGFFSATQVKYNTPNIPAGTMQVRARVFEDLENLRERYLPELTETIQIPNRDYPYRGYCTKEQWAAALGRAAMDIDYSNFKDTVKKEQGYERSDLYMGVWSIMFQAERKLEESRDKFRSMKANPRLPFEEEAERELLAEFGSNQARHERLQNRLDAQREAARSLAERRGQPLRRRNAAYDDVWEKYDSEPGVPVGSYESEVLELGHVNVVDGDYVDDEFDGFDEVLEDFDQDYTDQMNLAGVPDEVVFGQPFDDDTSEKEKRRKRRKNKQNRD